MRFERVGETSDPPGEGPPWGVGEQALYPVDSQGADDPPPRPGDRPVDGALFAVYGLGVTGLPEPRFAGKRPQRLRAELVKSVRLPGRRGDRSSRRGDIERAGGASRAFPRPPDASMNSGSEGQLPQALPRLQLPS